MGGTLQTISGTRRPYYTLIREARATFIASQGCPESSLSQTSVPHLEPSKAQFNMENGTVSQGEGKDPSGFLSEIIGSSVTVKLNSGVVYKGELQSIDGYINLALEKCEEHVDGVKRRSYGDAFVRGNNVMYISAD